MEFDKRAFLNAQMVARQAEIRVDGAAAFFTPTEEGEEVSPVWVVRGLTGAELSKVYELPARQTRLANIATALATANADREKIAEIRAALGLYDGLTLDVKKRLEMLTMGSVSPETPLPVARKIFDRFPVDFYNLTTKIMELTGLGAAADEGKS
jgi:hypothetical protein